MGTTAGAAPRDLVVVGAGAAGLSAVRRARADGFDGRITLVGSEVHGPYSRPPLSKAVLAGRADPRQATALGGADVVGELAELRLGRSATALDLASGHVVLGAERLPFDRLLVATGARARVLPVPGADLAGVHAIRTLEDSLQLRDAVLAGGPVVVVGAGVLGCEVAATLVGTGHDVTVVEPAGQPLLRAVGPLLGERIAALHRASGVRLVTGTGVRELVGTDRVEAVALVDGRSLPASVVVVAVGAVADTGWLRGSGVPLDDGVVCDEHCLSAVPGVAAAGDVARFPHPVPGGLVRLEHWTNAGEQGAVAVANLLLEPAERVPYVPVPYVWSDQHGRKIQVFGFPALADRVDVLEEPADPTRWLALLGRGPDLVAVVGCGVPARVARARGLLVAGCSTRAALVQLSSAASVAERV